jgi:GTP cyclohydrolase I
MSAFLRAIGRDPDAEPHLVGTANRVTALYMDELCEGYRVDPASDLRKAVVAGRTTIVALRDVAVTTMCPHHLMPASGVSTVAFAPRAHLVGLGALAQLLDAFAHRLILQEEIGEGVATTLLRELDAEWAACRLVMSHACISARAERKHAALAETFAFAGDGAFRAEAFEVVRGGV